MRGVCAFLIGLGILTGLAGPAPAPDPLPEPTRKDLLPAVEERLKRVVATVGPAVAAVVVSRSELYPKLPGPALPGRLGGFDRKEFLKAGEVTPERVRLAQLLDLSDPEGVPDHGYAGGVVIDPAGFVLTPYHVVNGATKVYVFLPGGKGSYADIHAADARSDLAVLRLLTPPEGLKAVRFAEVTLRPAPGRTPSVFAGKLCALLAYPYSSTFGFDRPSIGFGSIANVRTRLPRPAGKLDDPATRATEYGPLLEFDVRLNAAVTGAVLVNLDGELIGLATAGAVAWGAELGPGYAVPADAAFRRIVDVLRRGEEVEYGFLGVIKDRSRPGVVVERTTPAGPAEQGGIQPGDEIVAIDGVPVDSFDDLLFQVGTALAGTPVRVTVARFGRPRDVVVTLAKYRNDQPFIASHRPEPVFGLRVDYASILAQQQPLVVLPGTPPVRVPAGVWVREVQPDSPAAARFQALGDNPSRWVITQVNDRAVTTPAEFYAAARGRDKLKLTVVDPADPTGRSRELTLP